MQALFYGIIYAGMYSRKQRKKELIHRVLVYFVMTLSTLTLLAFLSFTVIGYQFNLETREIEQAGLVQFHSSPSGAMVSIDGAKFENTATKKVISPGVHSFTIKKPGYSDWRKELEIKPGKVTWLNYARLVPKEKKVESILKIKDIRSVKFSPSGKYLTGIKLDGKPSITLVDLTNQKPQKTEQPISHKWMRHCSKPQEKSKNYNWSVVGWDWDAEHFMVRCNYSKDKSQLNDWLLFDRRNLDKPVNISRLFHIDIKQVEFINSDGDGLYVLRDNGDINKLSVKNKTMSSPVISNVIDFDIYGADTISYRGIKDGKNLAGVWRSGWSSPVVIYSDVESQKNQVEIKVSHYFHKDTIILKVGDRVRLWRGSLEANELVADAIQYKESFVLGRPIADVSVSGNGRFILASDKRGFVTYDLERHTVSREVDMEGSKHVGWLDDYHIWQITEDGWLLMQEFDGSNSHDLMRASGFDVALGNSEKYIYGLKSSGGLVELKRLHMQAAN